MPIGEAVAHSLRVALLGAGYDDILIDPRGYRSPVAGAGATKFT